MYNTPRRDLLEQMLEKYLTDIERGETFENSINSLSVINQDLDIQNQRQYEEKQLPFLLATKRDYIETMKKDIFSIPEHIPDEQLVIRSRALPEQNKNPLDYDAAISLKGNDYLSSDSIEEAPKTFIMKKISERIHDMTNALKIKIDLYKHGENIDNAVEKFALESMKNSVTNLALDTKLKSSHYDSSFDKKQVMGAMKELFEADYLPTSVVRLVGTLDTEQERYIFDDTNRNITSFAVVKAYDEMAQHINMSSGTKKIDYSDDLAGERIQKIQNELQEGIQTGITKEQMLMSAYTYQTIKNTIELSNIAKAVDVDIPIEVKDNAENEKEMLELRRKISSTLEGMAADLSLLPTRLDVLKAFESIILLQEKNFKMNSESILNEKMPDSDKDIPLSQMLKTNIMIIQDSYEGVVSVLKEEIGRIEASSNEQLQSQILDIIPEQARNLNILEARMDSYVLEAIKDNNIQMKDIGQDSYIEARMTL